MESISTLYALPDFAGRIKVLAGTDPAVALKLAGGAVVDEAVKLVRSFAYAVSPQKTAEA
jgi:hypothetical protein